MNLKEIPFESMKVKTFDDELNVGVEKLMQSFERFEWLKKDIFLKRDLHDYFFSYNWEKDSIVNQVMKEHHLFLEKQEEEFLSILTQEEWSRFMKFNELPDVIEAGKNKLNEKIENIMKMSGRYHKFVIPSARWSDRVRSDIIKADEKRPGFFTISFVNKEILTDNKEMSIVKSIRRNTIHNLWEKYLYEGQKDISFETIDMSRFLKEVLVKIFIPNDEFMNDLKVKQSITYQLFQEMPSRFHVALRDFEDNIQRNVQNAVNNWNYLLIDINTFLTLDIWREAYVYSIVQQFGHHELEEWYKKNFILLRIGEVV